MRAESARRRVSPDTGLTTVAQDGAPGRMSERVPGSWRGVPACETAGRQTAHLHRASGLCSRMNVQRLVPVVDLEIDWRGTTPSRLDELTETEEKGCPLHAAVGGELDRLLPVAVSK